MLRCAGNRRNWHRFWRFGCHRTFLAILLVAIVLGASPVSAQVDDEGDRAALEAQYEKAFDEVFRDPGNLDKSFRFAELAIKIGNYEAAISALERMLLVNPNLPRVRLELWVLYFRLGSYPISQMNSLIDALRWRLCYKNQYVEELMEWLAWHTRWVNRNGTDFGSILTAA